MKSRRKKIEPILVVRGSVNGGCDPAMVMTTVASRVGGTGLPARVRVDTRRCKLGGSSIVLLRRVHAVSGGHLERGVNYLSGGVVLGISGDLRVDLKLFALWGVLMLDGVGVFF